MNFAENQVKLIILGAIDSKAKTTTMPCHATTQQLLAENCFIDHLYSNKIPEVFKKKKIKFVANLFLYSSVFKYLFSTKVYKTNNVQASRNLNGQIGYKLMQKQQKINKRLEKLAIYQIKNLQSLASYLGL